MQIQSEIGFQSSRNDEGAFQEFEIPSLFRYNNNMRGGSKKLAGRIFLVLTAAVMSALYPAVSDTFAEQPIFRGDTKGGVSQTTFIIDENNQSGDLKLQFGNALNEYIQWDNASSKFQISNNLDLLGHEISDFRMENQTSAPTCDPTKFGRMYYDSTINHGYLCNGSTWIQMDNPASEWLLASGVLSPASATSDFAVGGTTLINSMFAIDESAGIFLFGGDQSANPMLNFEATDNDAGSLAFNTNDTFAFTGAGVSIGTTTAVSPLHVYENDALTDATAGLTIEQDGTGDALAQFLLTGAQRWVLGIDQSDANKFKIGTTPLGTADKVSISSTSVQIGPGGAGTALPLFFGLDVKSSTGDPVSGQFEGAMYYNTTDNKFRCYQGAAWIDCIANDTLDTAFTNDADKILSQNSATDLAVDLTSTGDFVIKDAGTAFATFADDGTISLGKGSTSTTINMGSGSGTDTINIGTGGADVVNLGTGTSQKTISIGSSSTAATSVNVLSGSTGGIKLRPAGDAATGTVQIGEDASTTNPDLLRLGLKNNTGDPSGSAGNMYYNSSNDKFRCFENGAWVNCLPGTLRVAADVSNNSNNWTDVTGLTFPVASGQMYSFACFLTYTTSNTSNAINLSVNGPAVTALDYGVMVATNATTTRFSSQTAYNTVTNPVNGPGGTRVPAQITGSVIPSAAGTFAIRFKNDTSGAAVVIKRGSFCDVR